MATLSKTIVIEALSKLDPGTDEHWTADGQPKVDVVANFIGEGGAVTRKDIIEAAPEFVRANPVLTPVESPFDPAEDRAAKAETRTALSVLKDEIADLTNRIDALTAERTRKTAKADDIISSQVKEDARAGIHNIKRYLHQSRNAKILKARGGADPRKLAGGRERKPEVPAEGAAK